MASLKFRRIISAGNFIPEIDGLRFIAIISVVLFHLNVFFSVKDGHTYTSTHDFSWLNYILSHGDLGVPLFFVISGFILGKPFANSYLNKAPKVNLKNYFLRRVTRLEPPYILIMSLLFIGAVYVTHTLTFGEGIKSYLASITYTHNIFYGRAVMPLLNTVAWSLEIEIQFYILTPLLSLLFTIGNEKIRRISIAALALFFLAFSHFYKLPFISILEYLEFFLVGFLLADLYVTKTTLFSAGRADQPISMLLLMVIWIYSSHDFQSTSGKIGWETVQLGSIFLLYYLVLFHKTLKVLTTPLLTNIGGMCYTIYLLHFAIISMVGNPLLRIQFSDIAWINISIYSVLLLGAIFSISSLYFLLIERPCMDKDWYKKIFRKNTNTAMSTLGSGNT